MGGHPELPTRADRRPEHPAGPGHRAPIVALVALAAAVLAFSANSGASARTTQRASLADIERDVMCPTCGTPLMVSQSPLADRERAFIQTLIARGETRAQIERAMVDQFGPGILATPPARGFDLAAYLVLFAVAVLAVGGSSLAVAHWRRRGSPSAATAPPVPEALARRLDEDLSRYDL